MVSVLTSYLSHIAYWMFCVGRRQLTEAELYMKHAELQIQIEVLPNFAQLTERLISMQLLDKRNDSQVFRQPYIYYYFLRLYLHNHINDDAVQTAIQHLANELYREESASTLLFLAHHSKDRRILETLLTVCESQYIETLPTTLGEDVRFLNELSGTIDSLVIPDLPIAERRKQELEKLDLQRQEVDEFEQKNRKELEAHNTLLGKLNASLKTTQILGQFLKNFPADLNRHIGGRAWVCVQQHR